MQEKKCLHTHFIIELSSLYSNPVKPAEDADFYANQLSPLDAPHSSIVLSEY